ncbi:nitroreductase family protein [Spiroplasma endosymbiont of Panorpa germanica]|uniref:nitroreductase family protein n=1 Tax=Spiroplasma endosymbiont of Panorpa germanica TaxID=3066314 RepID=UPI0030D032C4
MKNLDQLIKERKTIKKYQQGAILPKEQILEIVNAGRMAPSGFGLQQVETIVILNQKVKDKIAEAFQGYNCENIKSASALIIVLGITTPTYEVEDGKLMDEKLLKLSKMYEDKKKEIKNNLLKIYPNMSFAQEYDKINAGIHIGYMSLKATELNIGSTIMTGFFVDVLTQSLQEMNLLKNGRRPIFGFALGKPDDNYAGNNREKIRVSVEDYANIID